MLMIALLLGCSETSPDTLVDELRVIASVASPPEVRPGEAFEYQSFAANPDGEDLETLTWVCTNFGEGCLEAQGGGTSLHASMETGDAPDWQRSLSVAPAVQVLLSAEESLTATQVWTLVCEAGTCPIIAAVGAATGEDPWATDWASDLADPLTWIADLPMTGVSVAYQLLTTSLSDMPHDNPTIEPADDHPNELPRGESFELDFTVDGRFGDQAQLYAYISAGGFMNLNTFVAAGDRVTVEGTSPESGDSVRVWMVLSDGNGGTQVWTSAFSLV